MSYADDRRLLVEIAAMYYEEGAKQADIAKKFCISRSLVSKYLAKARDLGLVEIIIHDDMIHPYKHIEDRLKSKFGLEEVICISPTAAEVLNKRLGATAAKYLTRIIQPTSSVGVSAGTTVQEIAFNFSPKHQLPGVEFIPMVGGLGHQHVNLQANLVCERFAQNSGATAIELHTPITVDTMEAKEVFLQQSFIKRVFEKARQVDIALVGIGSTPVYSTMRKAYLAGDANPLASDLSEEKNIVSDICYNFVTDKGELADCIWNQRVMALDLEDLKKIPLVIGVAGGTDKVLGIHAALVGKLINVLITDETAAKFLIDKY